ncbi:MAG: plasmid partition protein ParG [Nostocaceae cyanobacterium]|nr:plasmid partition protein ParG [Nostocaceae cyanobacterium]
MPRKTRTDRLNLSINENLKRRFNTLCTWKGVNMSDIAHELIEHWVEENTPPGLFNTEEVEDDDKQQK